MLIDVARLEKEYFETKPDVSDPNQLVAFHTSGHRGSSLYGTFTEAHILAITQMIRDYRRAQGIDGPTSTNGLNNLLAFRFANTLVEAFWNRN
jgi:phosphoglucomutase